MVQLTKGVSKFTPKCLYRKDNEKKARSSCKRVGKTALDKNAFV